jgi:hypothetical protein
LSFLLLSIEKRTFLNRNYYGSRDVLFGCLGVFKGQGNETESTFIFFTIKEMMKLLNLGNKKINKMLKELEAHNLIY